MPIHKTALRELLKRAEDAAPDHILMIAMREEDGALMVWATEDVEMPTAVTYCFMAMRCLTDGEADVIPLH